MNKIFSLRNIFIFFGAFILLLRFNLITSLIILFFNYIELLFSDYKQAIILTDKNLVDYFFSLFMLIIIPSAIYKTDKRKPFLHIRSLPGTSLALIIFAFIFAPVIVNYNPDFQKDLASTRLLSPLSSVTEIHLRDELPAGKNKVDSFIRLKKNVIKESFDASLIYCDSARYGSDSTLIFSGESRTIISSARIETENGNPFIIKRIFLLGTDEFGRDVFSRLVYGIRVSLFVGTCSVIISLIIGIGFGFIAGFGSPFINLVISRVTEMFLAFPLIFFIILILALFGNSIYTVIIVLGFSGWMSLLKIVKGEVVAIQGKDYFITARQLGLGKKKLLIKEVIPVIFVPIIVNLVFQFGNVILAESALSYLGLGTGNEFPSWGGMIQSGQENISRAWWLIFFPGIMIAGTLLTANRFGKALSIYFNPGLSE